VGAAIVMPEVNVEAMNEHLAVISCAVTAGATAVVVLDGAGWHASPRLKVPDNIILLPLPPYAPELNPVVVDACCNAWNGPMDLPHVLRSITDREYMRE